MNKEFISVSSWLCQKQASNRYNQKHEFVLLIAIDKVKVFKVLKIFLCVWGEQLRVPQLWAWPADTHLACVDVYFILLLKAKLS